VELTGPAIIEPIVGSVQTLSVDAVQQSRSFNRWSDGLTERQRSFTTGVSPQTFTAIFENLLPTAHITADTTNGQAPASFSFDGSASSDPEGDVLEFAWTDGRGGSSTSPTPTFTYPDPGTYDVQLTVTDQLGGTATSSVAITVEPSPPLPSGLVLGLGFDEGSGGAVLDVSGRGNNGTIAGATWTAGRYGQALSFDGTNDMVTVADAAALDFTQAFTISAWVRPPPAGAGAPSCSRSDRASSSTPCTAAPMARPRHRGSTPPRETATVAPVGVPRYPPDSGRTWRARGTAPRCASTSTGHCEPAPH